MKKIVLALTIALVGMIAAVAQPPRHHDMNPGQMVKERVERLDKALTLTPAQKTAITEVYTREMETMAKGRPSDKGSRPDEATMKAHHEKMKARREAVDAEVASLLTPEQAEKFSQLKQREAKRGHDGPRGHKGKKAPRQGDAGCQCEKK